MFRKKQPVFPRWDEIPFEERCSGSRDFTDKVTESSRGPWGLFGTTVTVGCSSCDFIGDDDPRTMIFFEMRLTPPHRLTRN